VLNDTWYSRDLPVLTAIAENYSGAALQWTPSS
jgi:hypothetical protein